MVVYSAPQVESAWAGKVWLGLGQWCLDALLRFDEFFVDHYLELLERQRT